MGFQAGAFQTPLAFQAQFPPDEQNSGGYYTKNKKPIKEDVFVDIYTGRKVPEPVIVAIEQVVRQELPTSDARKQELESQLPEIELKFIKLYLDILEQANNMFIESEIKRLLQGKTLKELQLEEDNLLLLLLLNSY